MTRDLPDDMIDAEPAGAWTGADAADGETADSSADALRAVQEEAPDEEAPSDASAPVAPPSPDGEPVSDPFVESAEIQQGEDPDLLTDDQARG